MTLAEAQEHLAATEKARDQLKEQVESMQAEKAQLEGKMADTEKAKLYIEATMQGEVAELSKKMVAATEENSLLRRQLSKLENKVAVTELDATTAKAEQARLTQEVDALEAEKT